MSSAPVLRLGFTSLTLGIPWLSRVRWCIMVLLSLHTCVSQFLIISLSRLLSPNMHIVAHWSKAELQWKLTSFILFHKRAYRKWCILDRTGGLSRCSFCPSTPPHPLRHALRNEHALRSLGVNRAVVEMGCFIPCF